VLLAIGGIGGVLGSVLGPRVATRFGGARTMVLAACVCPLVSMLAPLSTAGAGLVLFGAGLVGREVCITMFSLLARSYRQATVPRALLSRVTASIRFVSWGVLPVGALLGGALGELAGNRAALWVVCGLLLLTPLPILFSTVRGRRDLPDVPAYESQPA
jgi:predicted MFS family arabinose efflux permease